VLERAWEEKRRIVKDASEIIRNDNPNNKLAIELATLIETSLQDVYLIVKKSYSRIFLLICHFNCRLS
jgi:hypothetical protein